MRSASGPPAARTCDLYLPVKPGRDAALFAGVLQIMIERDWLDHAFIDAHTVGFEQVAEYCREWTLPRTAEVTGVPQRALMQAAEWWGTAKTSFLFHARGIEHHSNGVQNSLGTINLVLASGRIGKPKSGYGTIVGQANGQGGREHGQKCDQLPGWRDISNPEHRRYIAGVWGIDEPELPGPGVDAYELFRKIDRGEIKGLLSICFNPKVSLPDNAFITRCLDKLEFYAAIDFFLNDTAWHADVVLPASAHAEKWGTYTNTNRQVQLGRPVVDPPGEARQDWELICELARRVGLDWRYREVGEVFTEMASVMPSLANITWERILAEESVTYPCDAPDQPGNEIIFVNSFPTKSGRARIVPAELLPPDEVPDQEYPMVLTTGRLLEHWHTGSMTRRSFALDAIQPEAKVFIGYEDAKRLGVTDGDYVRVTSRRGSIELKASLTHRETPGSCFIPFHFREAAANLLTIDEIDPFGKIPEFKFCAVRIEPTGERGAPLEDARQAAEEASEILFGADPRLASPAALAAVAREVPVAHLETGEELRDGVPLGPVLQRAGLASSQSDARRQLEQGGVSVNGDKAGPDRRIGTSDALHDRWVLLRKGKKGWALVDLRAGS